MKGRFILPVCTPHGNVGPCTACLDHKIFVTRNTESLDRRRVYKGKFRAKP